jgi:hypothetical protein
MIERRAASRSQKQAKERKPKPEKRLLPLRACAQCDTPFQPQRSHQIYCGKPCAREAELAKIRDRKAAARTAAASSSHPLAERYPLTDDAPPPVTPAKIFRERFAWAYSNSSRRNVALRVGRMLGRDLESVERSIARILNHESDRIPHPLADALLLAARADHWRLPALPNQGATARRMAEEWAEIHDPELGAEERVELAHALTLFSEAYFVNSVADFDADIDPRVWQITNIPPPK